MRLMADEKHISLAIQRQIFVRRSETLVFEPPANFRVLRDPRVRLRPARSVHSISRITGSLIIRIFNATVPAQVCVRFPARMLASPGADVRMGPGADVGMGPGADVGMGPGADVGMGPGADVGMGPGADMLRSVRKHHSAKVHFGVDLQSHACVQSARPCGSPWDGLAHTGRPIPLTPARSHLHS